MAGACGRRQEDSAISNHGPKPQAPANRDPKGCEDLQGTLHLRCIAAGDIEASCSSDWSMPSATPKLSQHNGLGRGPRVAESWWPEGREGVGGRAEVTNIRASSPFAELRAQGGR